MPARAGQRRNTRRSAAATGADDDSRRERRSSAAGEPPPGVDRRIAELATRRDGIATRAALVAAGPWAVLSHLTAAVLWRLVRSPPPCVEVTVTRKGPRSRSGLRVHETRRPPEVRTIGSFPVTAPLRTLIDLGATQRTPELERLCAEALVLKLVSQQELEAAGIVDPDLVAPTRSRFERTFRAALRSAGLPTPIAGHPIGPYTADFAWPDEQVVVETDGYQFHGHRIAFEDDRARDAYLAARGWIVVRITWRRLKTLR